MSSASLFPLSTLVFPLLKGFFVDIQGQNDHVEDTRKHFKILKNLKVYSKYDGGYMKVCVYLTSSNFCVIGSEAEAAP